MAGTVPDLPWDDAIRALRWRQGEHLTLLGHTGGGKTSLARLLLPLRSYTVTVATKPRDESLEALIGVDGWHKSKRWPVDPRRHPRVVYWPDVGGLGSAGVERQREAVLDVLDSVWKDGGWTLFLDEVRYIDDQLGLRSELEQLLLQGRALGVTVVGSTQRPAHIPLEFYSEAHHLFLWRSNDRRNADRLGEIGGDVDAATIRQVVAGLVKHQVLYVNTRTGDMFTTMPPPPKRRR